jgi:restriction system protein
MALPTYDRFIEPILRFLVHQKEPISTIKVYEAVANMLGITDEEREEMLPSGTQQVYKNRAGWAHDRLKRAGLSSSAKRGYWSLTASGQQFAATHPSPLTDQQVEQLALGYINVPLKQAITPELQLEQRSAPSQADFVTISPEELLDSAVHELRESLAAELIDALLQVSPKYFETIVLDLLHKLGYGASRADLQQVGGSGDAGIDGIISLDKLGLEKVYVQAKRWQNTVGRPELQAFYGALAGQKAKKGVFITTSSYSSQTIEFSKSVDAMVLIDGLRLVELMMDYEVGVSSRIVRIPRFDSDYFFEE